VRTTAGSESWNIKAGKEKRRQALANGCETTLSAYYFTLSFQLLGGIPAVTPNPLVVCLYWIASAYLPFGLN
jgi:hypothetical protein